MALEKSIVQDKIELVAIKEWKCIQVRTATVITEDGLFNDTHFHQLMTLVVKQTKLKNLQRFILLMTQKLNK